MNPKIISWNLRGLGGEKKRKWAIYVRKKRGVHDAYSRIALGGS